MPRDCDMLPTLAVVERGQHSYRRERILVARPVAELSVAHDLELDGGRGVRLRLVAHREPARLVGSDGDREVHGVPGWRHRTDVEVPVDRRPGREDVRGFGTVRIPPARADVEVVPPSSSHGPVDVGAATPLV